MRSSPLLDAVTRLFADT